MPCTSRSTRHSSAGTSNVPQFSCRCGPAGMTFQRTCSSRSSSSVIASSKETPRCSANCRTRAAYAHAVPQRPSIWGYCSAISLHLIPSPAGKKKCRPLFHVNISPFPRQKPVNSIKFSHHVSHIIRIQRTGILYHDAAKRPQQNRTCCGFAWFNVLKALRTGTGARATHTRSRANGGFEVMAIPYFQAHTSRTARVH